MIDREGLLLQPRSGWLASFTCSFLVRLLFSPVVSRWFWVVSRSVLRRIPFASAFFSVDSWFSCCFKTTAWFATRLAHLIFKPFELIRLNCFVSITAFLCNNRWLSRFSFRIFVSPLANCSLQSVEDVSWFSHYCIISLSFAIVGRRLFPQLVALSQYLAQGAVPIIFFDSFALSQLSLANLDSVFVLPGCYYLDYLLQSSTAILFCLVAFISLSALQWFNFVDRWAVSPKIMNFHQKIRA